MIVNVEDFRLSAKRQLPRIFFDYIDGGSFSETTLRRNRSDFDKIALRQNVLSGHADFDLRTNLLGWHASMPLMLGPVGFLGLYRGNGDVAAARAAVQAGIGYCLSTFSINSIETVARQAKGMRNFQLYVLDDEALTEELIAAAERADVSALFVTVDSAITSIREKEVRSGFRSATRLTVPLIWQMVRRPGWCFDILRHGMPTVEVLKNRADFGRTLLEQSSALARRIDKKLDWTRVEWLRQRWKGKLVIKGILTPEDARKAVETGADAIVVSNHGGRQLDSAASTIAILPQIAEKLAGSTEILIDSGFRRGADLLKALALGADGILLGRAYAFALASGGGRGVTQALDILREEMTLNLALMGLGSVAELKRRGCSALHFLGKTG